MGVIKYLGMEFSQTEGLSIIRHQDKDIVYIDYSRFGGDKEKSLQLIKVGTELYTEVYAKYNSRIVLGIINVENLQFDTELLAAFKETQTISERANSFCIRGSYCHSWNVIILRYPILLQQRME